MKDHNCQIGKLNPRFYNVKITFCWTCYKKNFDKRDKISTEIFTPPSSPRLINRRLPLVNRRLPLVNNTTHMDCIPVGVEPLDE